MTMCSGHLSGSRATLDSAGNPAPEHFMSQEGRDGDE